MGMVLLIICQAKAAFVSVSVFNQADIMAVIFVTPKAANCFT